MRLFSIRIFLFAYLSLFPLKQWAAISRASKTSQEARGREQFSSCAVSTPVRVVEIHYAAATDLTRVADLAERVAPWLAKNIVLLSIAKSTAGMFLSSRRKMGSSSFARPVHPAPQWDSTIISSTTATGRYLMSETTLGR